MGGPPQKTPWLAVGVFCFWAGGEDERAGIERGRGKTKGTKHRKHNNIVVRIAGRIHQHSCEAKGVMTISPILGVQFGAELDAPGFAEKAVFELARLGNPLVLWIRVSPKGKISLSKTLRT